MARRTTTRAKSPFKPAWVSFDLGDYRPCDGTYEVYPAKSLPPVHASDLDEAFSYLGRERRTKQPAAAKLVARLEREASKAGLSLPADFVYLMSRPALCRCVPSCTACEWTLSEHLIPSKALRGAFTVRFLKDQQDVFFWYLFLAPGLEPSVVVSPIPYDDPRVKRDVDRRTLLANSGEAAPSFGHFVFRWWLENELWDALDVGRKLTPRQRAYVDHYA